MVVSRKFHCPDYLTSFYNPMTDFSWSNWRKHREDFWPKNVKRRNRWHCSRCTQVEVRWSERRPCGGWAPSHWPTCTASDVEYFTKAVSCNKRWSSFGIEPFLLPRWKNKVNGKQRSSIFSKSTTLPTGVVWSDKFQFIFYAHSP